jgi:hypothetical protein
MSTSVANSFIKDFESEVHTAYQRMGAKLRLTVRNKTNIIGADTTFQKVGKGTAGTKTRHGLVPVMNADHTPVNCTLADYYAGDWVDKLDELKTNIDEMKTTAEAGAYALGRQTDSLIITALDGATNTSSVAIASLTKAIATDWVMDLFARDIPSDDGNTWGLVSWQVWGALLLLPEFTSSDYIASSGMQFQTGVRPRMWLGVNWLPHSGLTVGAGGERKCYVYHKTAIGHASGADVSSDITWHGDRASHFVNNMMSQGSVMIDVNGIQELIVDEVA